jgi:hypothetical protein
LVHQTPLLVSSSLHIFQAWRALQFYSSFSYDSDTVLRMKAILVNTTLPVAYTNTRMVFTGIVPWENVTCADKHSPWRNTSCRPVFPFIYVGKHTCDVSMSYSWLMPMPLNLASIWSWENIFSKFKRCHLWCRVSRQISLAQGPVADGKVRHINMSVMLYGF